MEGSLPIRGCDALSGLKAENRVINSPLGFDRYPTAPRGTGVGDQSGNETMMVKSGWYNIVFKSHTGRVIIVGQKQTITPFIFRLGNSFINWRRRFISIQMYNSDRFVFHVLQQDG